MRRSMQASCPVPIDGSRRTRAASGPHRGRGRHPVFGGSGHMYGLGFALLNRGEGFLHFVAQLE